MDVIGCGDPAFGLFTTFLHSSTTINNQRRLSVLFLDTFDSYTRVCLLGKALTSASPAFSVSALLAPKLKPNILLMAANRAPNSPKHGRWPQRLRQNSKTNTDGIG